MPKMKSHRASAKRFKVTGRGKILRRRGFRNHLLEKKSSRRKRRLAGYAEIPTSQHDHVKGKLGL